jgi:hypothetical protein
MITEETVFILGAGASMPYGYPSGEGLSNHICSFENKFDFILNNFDQEDKKNELKQKMTELVKKLKNAPTTSIDLFLARNRGEGFLDFGKMAILFSIFHFEIHGKNFRDLAKEGKNQDWFSYLYKKMTNDLKAPDDRLKFKQNKVSFITFNYDRSLEHFFYESLKNSFTYTNKELLTEVKSIPIFHVYGKISDLDWERDSGEGIKYLYHSNKKVQHLFTINKLDELRGNIKLMYQNNVKTDYSKLVEKIKTAKKIFFLGFGYSEENMEVLEIGDSLSYEQDIYGTAYELSEKRIEEIRRMMKKNWPSAKTEDENPKIIDTDCLGLLKQANI